MTIEISHERGGKSALNRSIAIEKNIVNSGALLKVAVSDRYEREIYCML